MPGASREDLLAAVRQAGAMRHLGDGVYADFDGWQVRLRANHHESPVVVYLDPGVRTALRKWLLALETTIAAAQRGPTDVDEAPGA